MLSSQNSLLASSEDDLRIKETLCMFANHARFHRAVSEAAVEQ
jgi:hypothetical protein